jgi:hypothetical protein
MDRFNSTEEIPSGFKSEATDIIYSDGSSAQKVTNVIQAQRAAYLKGQDAIISDLEQTMQGVVFIDREFIQGWIMRMKKNLPVYED